MKKAAPKVWKTCANGHKYRGAVCPICWGAKKEKEREKKARAAATRRRAPAR